MLHILGNTRSGGSRFEACTFLAQRRIEPHQHLIGFVKRQPVPVFPQDDGLEMFRSKDLADRRCDTLTELGRNFGRVSVMLQIGHAGQDHRGNLLHLLFKSRLDVQFFVDGTRRLGVRPVLGDPEHEPHR